MDIANFLQMFSEQFKPSELTVPCDEYLDPVVSAEIDLCPDVEGMTSIKKQLLLNLAFNLLKEGECYLEVGTFQGKSLISAMLNNPQRTVFACDNFSQFDNNSYTVLESNLSRYEVLENVTFYDLHFEKIYNKRCLPVPIGLYFYDGAHDYHSQYAAIGKVEPFLADEALVLVDDWRYAEDSKSQAKAATLDAVNESKNQWKLLYELPARFNGDRAMWWNGLGIFSFNRLSISSQETEL